MAKTDERFSPPSVLELRDAVWVEGTDTDPAWHPRSFSKARNCYRKRDNGLKKPWFGRVWLNPPWSTVLPWLVRLLEHLDTDAAHEGMMLVRNDPSTEWFKRAEKRATAIAFMGERTRYWQLEGTQVVECGTPEFSSVLFYFGPRVREFVAECRRRGHIALRLRSHSKPGTVPSVPRRTRRAPEAASADASPLLEQIRVIVADFARNRPDATLGELAEQLGETASVLHTLRVRDFWPQPTIVAPGPKNGAAKVRMHVDAEKLLRSELTPAAAVRVEQVRAVIRSQKLREFKADTIIEALGVSRQTALRALKHLPEVHMVGKAKHARYVVNT